jgi:hypothetical protein
LAAALTHLLFKTDDTPGDDFSVIDVHRLNVVFGRRADFQERFVSTAAVRTFDELAHLSSKITDFKFVA